MPHRLERYKAVFVRCVFPKSETYSVTDTWGLSVVSSRPCKTPDSMILVQRIPTQPSSVVNFTVCLGGALQNSYSDAMQFVEWMETSAIFGAERFQIYNHSGASALDPYIDYYRRLGRLELTDWILPQAIGENDDDLWYKGQFALVNDCLYRHMYRTKYLVYMDFDEMIVPSSPGATTWQDMMTEAKCTKTPVLIVRNVYFPRNWPDNSKYNENVAVHKLHLQTLLKIKRRITFSLPGVRSKIIVRPELTSRALVHTAWGISVGYDIISQNGQIWTPSDHKNEAVCHMEPDAGRLHHYRHSRVFERTEVGIIDPVMEKFEARIINQTLHVHKAVNQKFTI